MYWELSEKIKLMLDISYHISTWYCNPEDHDVNYV